MGQSATDRYRVCVWGRLHDGAPHGSVDVTEGFASRYRAELFAREVSRRIPSGVCTLGLTLAWVLVYAMPDSSQRGYSATRGTLGQAYLVYDHGAVVVKRHAILQGYHGHHPAEVSLARSRGLAK